MEDFEKLIGKIMRDQNRQGLPDFEGFSPAEMQYILYDPLGSESPVKLKKLKDEEYRDVPMLNLVRYLMERTGESGEIKLTAKGFLPVKLVADMYGQGFIKEYFIETGLDKLYKEVDSKSIHLAKILADVSGLVKKRNRKLSLTKKGEKMLSDPHEMLRMLMLTQGNRFNMAYFDGYGQNKIAQLGWAFSLILLSKYGNVKRRDTFYAEKYFKAFPTLLEMIEPGPYTSNIKKTAYRCYSIRTFRRFFDFFGLVNIQEANIAEPRDITKTSLFDKLIECPHRDNISMN